MTFFLAAAALTRLHVPSPARADLAPGAARKSLANDIREGLLFVWHRLVSTNRIGDVGGRRWL